MFEIAKAPYSCPFIRFLLDNNFNWRLTAITHLQDEFICMSTEYLVKI